MAYIKLEYVEDEEGSGNQTVSISRSEIEDIHDVIYFLAEAMRAIGYKEYDRVAVATPRGEITWSVF